MIREEIEKAIQKGLTELGITAAGWRAEPTDDLSHGDFATNVALVAHSTGSTGSPQAGSMNSPQAGSGQAAKGERRNPHELAEELVRYIVQNKPQEIEKVEIAGPGFINFHLSRKFFTDSVKQVLDSGETFGKNKNLSGKRVMVEYTDPNPFKEFHIGHLMSNAVGESISRLVEFSGAEIRRANYQGDVGLHVAKAIWGKMQKPDLGWAESYSYGAREYDNDKEKIDTLNKTIYERSDEKVNALYDQGRMETLEGFESIYKKLGTKFDEYFFERETATPGKKIVEEKKNNVFIESERAIIFPQEKSGLHTRVFINSQGLPTYEAKELALAKLKYDRYSYDESIVITGNEVNEYFKVVHKAMELVYPDLAEKTKHLSHGMLRLPSGKMSSRTGDVITALSLVDDAKKKVLEKMEKPEDGIAEKVAIGAIKYSILKQAIGKDIIFDFDKSLSLEGDSGPYLQYSVVRARSVLQKALTENIAASTGGERPAVSEVERLIPRFPNVIEEAAREYAPQGVVHYLLLLASAFNAFYAQEKIVDASDPHCPYKLALTHAVATVIANGLWVLGIPVPEKM